MEIKVVGPGCANCKNLLQKTQDAVKELTGCIGLSLLCDRAAGRFHGDLVDGDAPALAELTCLDHLPELEPDHDARSCRKIKIFIK